MGVFSAILLLALTAAPSGEPDGILDPLIEKCAEIDDEYMAGKTGTEARLSIMRSLKGKIGPITYVHSKFRNTDTSVRDTAFGKTYTGTAEGPRVFPTAGKYVAIVPPGFEKRVKKWSEEALKGNSTVARAELASALFTEAYVGKGGQLNEEKMFLLYRAAAEDGNAGAMFMCGICRYYGIGIAKDEKKALKMLKRWKDLSGETKAKRGGWVARRFETINK